MSSQIGHGGTGLLGDLRGFGDFQSDGGAARRAYVDLALGKSITKTSVSGGVYYTDIPAADLKWAGAIRPVVGLECRIAPYRLERVERQADVVNGTWFCDDSTVETGGTVTVHYKLPDGSDPGTDLLIAHLLFTFGARGEAHPIFGPSPAADPGFAYWTNSTTPTYWLKDNESSGGGDSGVAVTQSTDLSPASYDDYSCKIAPGVGTLLGGDSGGVYLGSMKLRAGRHNWLPFAYKTDPDMPTGLEAAVRARAGAAVWMLADGTLTTGSANNLVLPRTRGEWRRGLLVWRQPADEAAGEVHLRLVNTTGSAISTGWVLFDSARPMPVYRYAYYAPALDLASIPDVEVRAADAFFGDKTIGIGAISLIDQDKALLSAFGSLYTMRKPVSVWVGGAFSNGPELTRDDWRAAFHGVTQRPTFRLQSGRIEIEIEDARTLAKALALDEPYRPAAGVDLALEDEGATKNLLFGETLEQIIKGRRVAADANGYGAYELLDPRVPVLDANPVILPAGWAPKVFPNEALADKGEKGYELKDDVTAISVANPTQVTCFKRHGLATNDQVTLSATNSTPSIDGRRTVTVVDDFKFTVAVNVTVAGNAGKVVSHADVDYSNQNTRFLIKRDIANRRYNKAGEDVGTGVKFPFKIGWDVTEENRYLDFDITNGVGAPVRAAVVTGSYTSGSSLATAVQTAMRAVGDATINVSYGSNKFTIARAGNIILKFGLTATVEAQGGGSLHRDLGFKTQDRANAASHTGDYDSFHDLTVPPLVASLDIDGPAWKAARDLRQALRDAVGGGDTTMDCSYSESIHEFTTSKSSGVLSLIMPSIPANSPMEPIPEKSGWGILGYDTRTNKTGGTSYTSDQPTFTDADADHVIRWPGGGYKDDAAGSICGLADASIDSAPALAAWLWRKVVRLPASRLDVLSFKAARLQSLSTDFATLFWYVDDPEKEIAKLLGDADRVGLMDQVIDGEGIVRCVKHRDNAPIMRDFQDRDYLSLEMWQDPAMTYKAVRVWGAYNPALKTYASYLDSALINAGDMYIKAGATETLDVFGNLSRGSITGGLCLVPGYLARLIGKLPRWAEFSAAGKLVDLLPGHRIRMSASNALGPGGSMQNVNFRIVGLRHNYLAAISTCLAVEDVQILT